jgi:hypothetical protein
MSHGHRDWSPPPLISVFYTGTAAFHSNSSSIILKMLINIYIYIYKRSHYFSYTISYSLDFRLFRDPHVSVTLGIFV